VSGTVAGVVERHRSSGRTFEAGGLRSFVLEQGDGPPVLCLHGVPASSFLYRKVLSELEARGLRGVAFDRPWPMHPFSIRGVGEAWLALMRPPTFGWIFRHVGITDNTAISDAEVDAYSDAEVDAYLALMKRGDGGRAFLRIMRGFELTQAKQAFFYEGLGSRPYPAQVVWGRNDPMLGDERRRAVQHPLGIECPILLPARHFLQEDQAPAVAEAVAELTRGR
jgi:haloalkane dehalogenase